MNTEEGIHVKVNSTAASANMNMNMSSCDRGIQCRKVLGIISITWHPFLSLPFSFSDSISLSPFLVILVHPSLRHRMQKGLSSHSLGIFLPSGSCDLFLSSPFSILISMPSIGVTVEQYWWSIKSLSLHLSLYFSLPFIHFSDFNFQFSKFQFQFQWT